MRDTSSRPDAAPSWRPQAAWAVLCLLGLAIVVVAPRWAAVSFYLIWISFALLFGLLGWHAHRKISAETARLAVSVENERLLAAQRRFLVDASHQLKTPITIALGHAELLARDLAGQDGKRDIHVVVGELNRLKSLSERLLLIAASENPDFLRPEPVELAIFAMELLRRWRPAAARRWRVGQLDDAVVTADGDRLALAIDALLENAVQHTGDDDVIRVSVLADEPARFACVIIEDSGEGIPAAELGHVFDRFRSGTPRPGQHGSGQHGSGQHGSGQHGSGQHGSGQHGSGQHGSGQDSLSQHSRRERGDGRQGLDQRGTGQQGLSQQGLSQHGLSQQGLSQHGLSQHGLSQHGRREGGDGRQGSGQRGTGLGLALAQAIARGHGGEVRVHSTLGEGSRFEFLLPMPAPETAAGLAAGLAAAGDYVPGPAEPAGSPSPCGPGRLR